MINKYQNFLINNKEICWEIVKKVNGLNESFTNRKGKERFLIDLLEVRLKYDWVIFEIKNKVSIGLDFPVSFYGTGWGLADFEKEVSKRTLVTILSSLKSKFSVKDTFCMFVFLQ